MVGETVQRFRERLQEVGCVVKNEEHIGGAAGIRPEVERLREQETDKARIPLRPFADKVEQFQGKAGLTAAGRSGDATDGDRVWAITPGKAVLPNGVAAREISNGIAGEEQIEVLVPAGIEFASEGRDPQVGCWASAYVNIRVGRLLD